MLALHKYQTVPNTPQFNKALRWQWYLAQYGSNDFFQHIVSSVIKISKLIDN